MGPNWGRQDPGGPHVGPMILAIWAHQMYLNMSHFFSTYSKKLLEASNLIDIQRKMELYKAIFYCNVQGDRDPNYIKAESLQIELIAGGLSWEQQQYVMEKMQPNSWREVRILIEPHTVRCRYKADNFVQNPHNRHPLAHPWGRGMGCLLWL